MEGKGITVFILGIVAAIAVVGLVMQFTGTTGNMVNPALGDKLYGGGMTRGPMYETGFVRDSTNRMYAGALYGYEYGDTGRERIQDSGDGIPYSSYDTDPKRTPPILGDPCPFDPYHTPLTLTYAHPEECIPMGYNPANGEQYDLGVNRYHTQVCCITAVR